MICQGQFIIVFVFRIGTPVGEGIELYAALSA